MAMRNLLLAAGAVLLTPVSASAAEAIINGGFEDPAISSPCCNTVPPDSLPGWTVNSGNVNVVNGTFSSSAGNLAFEGSQYLDLVGQGGVGSISQIFNTVSGQLYNLSLVYSHNLFSGTPSASASFSVDGLAGVVTHSTGSTSNLDWRPYSGSFVAAGSSTTLNFTNLTGGANEGIFLDAVSVNAVPEPATWAMMLVGFGLVGGAMRSAKRRQKLIVSYT
jgi:hypothetical protein